MCQTHDTVLEYGQALVLSASSVQVVEFYSDSSKIGEATASSGYTVHWAKPPVGTST